MIYLSLKPQRAEELDLRAAQTGAFSIFVTPPEYPSASTVRATAIDSTALLAILCEACVLFGRDLLTVYDSEANEAKLCSAHDILKKIRAGDNVLPDAIVPEQPIPDRLDCSTDFDPNNPRAATWKPFPGS